MRKSILTVLGPTDPIYDLTTVDAVNDALGIAGNTTADGIMAEKITRTSKMIGELCDRVFALLTVSESFRVNIGEPVHVLYLRQYPVTDVVSIAQGGSEATADYELDDESGLLWMKCGRWSGEIVCEYSGGYDLPEGAPALLSQACIETLRAQQSFATRDPTIRSTTHGDTSVTYTDPFRTTSSTFSSGVLPATASDMIQQYRRLSV